MNIIAISDFKKCKDPSQIMKLFEMGLYRYHIKEPYLELESFINEVEEKYLNRISYHGDGRSIKVESHGKLDYAISESCHSMEELKISDKEYCFLSPIYDSISKKGYKSTIDFEVLKEVLKENRKVKVFALGGITEDNIIKASQLGFDGVAVRGFLWDMGKNPMEQFAKLI